MQLYYLLSGLQLDSFTLSFVICISPFKFSFSCAIVQEITLVLILNLVILSPISNLNFNSFTELSHFSDDIFNLEF